jgi:SAM-dependent methyltransferase
MLKSIRRSWYQFLKLQDYRFGVWSCRLMQVRGFADRPIHPKHLFDNTRSEFIHGLFREQIKFLDIGSGVGSECLLAAESGAAISVGVEGNMQSILTAKQRGADSCPGVLFLQVDLEDGVLPFSDSIFDVINFSNVLEHLHKRGKVLEELKRVKKTDGICVISIPNTDTSWKRRLRSVDLDSRDDPDHKVEYTKQSLHEELNRAGLQVSSELQPIIPSWPWNGMIAMSAALSPKFYRRMQRYKRDYVRTNPDESIGWVFTVR